MKIVLLDGDVLRYELGAIAIKVEEIFGMRVEKPWSTSEVFSLVDSKVQSIMERAGGDTIEVFLTGPGNFRVALATIAPYKGQRTGDKPHHWETVGRRLIDHWGAKEYHGIEADDAMAIRATELPGQCIVASRDKDLRQVPGFHYSWACGEHQPERPTYEVNELGWVDFEKTTYDSYKLVGDGLKFFYGQMLVGDTVDNIKGCPRIGPMKAATALKFMDSEEECFNAVVPFYIKVYGDDWKRNLLENARLLFLIRDRSWISEDPDGYHIKCYLKQLWELPYDYSGYASCREGEDCNEGVSDCRDPG